MSTQKKKETKKPWMVELTEEQVALARIALNGDNTRPFSYANNDHINGGHEAEEKMRKKHDAKVKQRKKNRI